MHKLFHEFIFKRRGKYDEFIHNLKCSDDMADYKDH